jgi:ABC-type lipoprotein export system ATPase subunit
MSQPAIRLDDVSVTYQRGEIAVDAVRGVSLEIPSGDFVAIEGPSGSGKSTLLRSMAGLWPVTSGRVWVEGELLTDRSDAELAIMRRRRIGFVHQLFNLLPDLTAAENVSLPLLLDGVRSRDADARVAAAMETLGIGDLGKRRPEALSGGEMLRVALARALVIEPALILADEPTGSLDQRNGAMVLDIFKRLHAEANSTFVIVTHDPNVAAGASRRLRLVDGKLQ